MSADIIEAEYRNLPAVVDHGQFMPIMDLVIAKKRRDSIIEFTRECMKVDHDFGTIPGTPKPTLYKAGAEKLCTLFGLTPRFQLVRSEEDWGGERHGGEAFFFYIYRCQLYRGDFLVAEADGSCNSWEKKYRYVNANRKCPNCNAETIFNSKGDEGGYFCWKTKGGCGAQFKKGDGRIEGQETGKKPNPDISDLVNTFCKMSQKRALIAATLLATNASEFYTQDAEDIPRTESAEVASTTQEAPQEQQQAEPPNWKTLLEERAKGKDLPFTTGLIGKLVGRKIVSADVSDWDALYAEAYQVTDEKWGEVIASLKKKPAEPKLSDRQDAAMKDWLENYEIDHVKFSEIVGRDVTCGERGFTSLTDDELGRVESYISTGVMPRQEQKLEVVAGGVQ